MEKEKVEQITESFWLSLHNEEKVEQRLVKQGLSVEELEIAKTFMKKKRCAARRASGVIWLIAGILMLGIGFISTVFLFHSGDSFQMVMYGLTLIGLSAVGFGCYLVFA